MQAAQIPLADHAPKKRATDLTDAAWEDHFNPENVPEILKKAPPMCSGHPKGSQESKL